MGDVERRNRDRKREWVVEKGKKGKGREKKRRAVERGNGGWKEGMERVERGKTERICMGKVERGNGMEDTGDVGMTWASR